MSYRFRPTSPAVLWTGGVTICTLAFGRVQNSGQLVGGDISLAKTLWLNLTILAFLVLPALQWRDRRVDPRMRTIFAVIFGAFLVRAAIELPILYLTDWWRCSYGIAHDLFVAGAALALFVRTRSRSGGLRTEPLLWFIVVLLLVEGGFAYAFCSVADPGAGTYFASDETTFRAINRATWIAVGAGYVTLAALAALCGPKGAENDPVGPESGTPATR